MSATINTRKGNIAMEYLKKTAGYVTGATGEYIKDVMPVTGSTISDAKDTLQELNSKFKTTSASIMPKLRQLKQQANFRTISNWFLQKEDEFDDFGNIDSNLDFDIDTDAPSEVVQAQITEWGKNADQISKTVVATTSKMVDAQISATANMLSAIDQQTAVISSGFDKTNSTLNKILEVVTKNTTALIETNVAKESSNDKLTRGGFNFNEYKKLVSTNMKNSEYGLMAAMIPMMMSLGKNAITPQEIIKGGLGFLVNKTAPNFKTNMAALDKAVGDAIMGSLIRLGESDNPIARMFGVDGNRKNASTQRSSLELKAVPFDTVTKEAITNAIPGYLRQILVALGGPDQIYDYRSRSFKTKAAIKREFGNLVASQGTMRSSSNNVRKSFTPDEFTDMMYDLTLNELGSMKTSDARSQLASMDNSKNAKKFARKLLSGVQLSSKEKGAMDRFANELSRAIDAGLGLEIMNQLGATNIARNQRGRDVINNMQNMSMDTSYLRNNAKEDRRTLLQSRGMVNDDSSVSVKNPNAMLSGTNYTNMALYEIYRRLNEGINVYQVGEAKGSARQRERYLKLEDSYLHIPLGHRPKPIRDPKVGEDRVGISGINDDGTPEPNELRNQELEDGSTENLTKGQRFSRWGKSKGKSLLNAIFKGTPEDVQNVFGSIVSDVAQVGGDVVKSGLTKINDSFGDIKGYMKHKFFGGKWTDPIDGKEYDGDGYIGKIGKSISSFFKGDSSKNIPSLMNLFAGDSSGDPEADKKRKKIAGAAAGALGAQLGFMGGPIGMIIGGLAGSAIATSGIGKKISKFVLGEVGEDKKRSGGLIQKIGNFFSKKLGYTDDMDEDTKAKRKRTQMIGGIVGAFAGAGLIGAPMAMVVGGLAGAALSTTGIGDKIQNLIFGKKIDGKRTGGVVDKVLAPFRQIGKTAKNISSSIAKRILDPISDIMFLAKEKAKKGIGNFLMGVRDSKTGQYIGGIFSGIANGVSSVKKWIGDKTKSLFGGIFTLLGTGLKTIISSPLVALRMLNPLAIVDNFSEEGRQKIGSSWKDNVTDAKGFSGKVKGFGRFFTGLGTDQIRDNKGSVVDRFAGKEYKDAIDKRRADRARRRGDPAAVTEEVADNTEKVADNTAKVAETQSDMLKHMRTKSKDGSIYTHDHIMHDLMRDLIDVTGKGIRGNNGSGDPMNSSIMGAAATVTSMNSDVSDEEYRITTDIVDKSTNDTASKQTLGQKLKILLGLNKKNKKDGEEGDPEEKESIWEKLFGGIGSVITKNLPLIVAGLALLNGNVRDILFKVAGGVDDALKNSHKETDPVTEEEVTVTENEGFVHELSHGIEGLTNGFIDEQTARGVMGSALDLTAIQAARIGANKLIGGAIKAGGSIASNATFISTFNQYRSAGNIKSFKDFRDVWGFAKDAAKGTKASAGNIASNVTSRINSAAAAASGFDIAWEITEEKKNQQMHGDYGMARNAGGFVRTPSTWKYVGMGVAAAVAAIVGGPVVLVMGLAALAGVIANLLVGWIVDGLSENDAVRTNSSKVKAILEGKLKSDGTDDVRYIYNAKTSDRALGLTKGLNYLDPEIEIGALMNIIYGGYQSSYGAEVLLYDVLNNMAYQGVPVGVYATEKNSKVTGASGKNYNKEQLSIGMAPINAGVNDTQVKYSDVKNEAVLGEVETNVRIRKPSHKFNLDDAKNIYKWSSTVVERLKKEGIIKNNGSVDQNKFMYYNDSRGRTSSGWRALETIFKDEDIQFACGAVLYINSKIDTDWKKRQWIDKNEATLDKVIQAAVAGAGIKATLSTPSQPVAEIAPEPEASLTGEQTSAGSSNSSSHSSPSSSSPSSYVPGSDPFGDEILALEAAHMYSNPDLLYKWASKQPEYSTHPDLNKIKDWRSIDWNDPRYKSIQNLMREWAFECASRNHGFLGLNHYFDWNKIKKDYPNYSPESILGGNTGSASQIWKNWDSGYTYNPDAMKTIMDGFEAYDPFTGERNTNWDEYGIMDYVTQNSQLYGNGGTYNYDPDAAPPGIGGAIDPYAEDDAGITSRINLDSGYENNPGFIGPVRSENMIGGNPLGKPYQLNAGMDEFGHSSIMGNYPGHTGIDLASSDGNQENVPVYSRFSGIVEEVNRSNTGFGNMVSIRTNDGILIKNAHLGSIASGVQPNAEVTPGKQLGIMGSTGSSTGPHLHYEMRDLNNQVIDPYPTLTSGISGSNNTDIGSEAGYNDYGSPAGGTEEDTTNKRTGFFGLIDGLLDIANSFFSNIFGKISGNSTSTDYSNSGNSWFSFPGSNNSQSPSGSSIYDSYSPQYGTVDGPVQMLPKADMAKIGWGSGQEAEIIDMRHQGLSYKIYGNGKYSTHTDYTTVTKNDTATKLQAAGGKWTWNDGSEIPVLLKFKGKYYAAATHSFPHGRKTVQGADNGLVHHPGWSGDKDTNNGNYGGHFCLWYVDSTGNGNQDPTSARAKRYHAAVEEAYRLGIEMFGESTNTSSSISPGTLSSGTDNASRIYNFLVEKGLTPEAAAAIVGNIQAESYDNIRPDTYTIDTNGKPSGGIAQWNDDRFTKMANAVPDWKTNFDGQLQYLWDDMHGKYGWNLDNRMNHNSWEKGFREKGAVPLTGGLEEFKRMTDVEAATKLFDATYEISGGDSSSRIKNAKAFLSSIGSGTSSTYRASSSPGQQSLMYDDGGTGGSGIGGESIRIRNRGGIGGSITSPQFMSRSKNRSDASIGTSFTSKASSRSSSRTSTSKYRPDAGGIFDQDDEENVSSRDVDVRSILKFILEELKDINGNTDEANTFLDSLNKKDFGTPNTTVDSGIRNQSSRRKNTFNQQNGNNTKTIGSIVRG